MVEHPVPGKVAVATAYNMGQSSTVNRPDGIYAKTQSNF